VGVMLYLDRAPAETFGGFWSVAHNSYALLLAKLCLMDCCPKERNGSMGKSLAKYAQFGWWGSAALGHKIDR
jgi:hypothetical protein